MNKKALFWQKTSSGVQCLLCPNLCLIKDNEHGICRKRINQKGELFATNYARTISLALDPIEKKPLYHFHPGTKILSLGANSCNLSCQFCQNYATSQKECTTHVILPEELLTYCQTHQIRHVAFTYTEPFTWYEYILDTAPLLQKAGISVVLVTNGYINPEPLKLLIPYISAMNIDLKAFSPFFYHNICGGQLQPVLDSIRFTNRKIHLEITLLLIETLNDDPKELLLLFSFLKDLNPDIPLHISRYFPRYLCNLPATNTQKLLQTVAIAKKYLNYVYEGNL